MSHTSKDHPDYQHINEASAKAQELANQVNDGVKEEDNSDKLEWVQNHVTCDGLTEVCYYILLVYYEYIQVYFSVDLLLLFVLSFYFSFFNGSL